MPADLVGVGSRDVEHITPALTKGALVRPAMTPPLRRNEMMMFGDVSTRSRKPRNLDAETKMFPSPELDPSQTKDLSKVERERLARNIATAGDHFLAERFGEVERITKQLLKKHPAIAEIHELHGLTLYRLGKWSDALERLEHFTRLTGDVDQFPVMADCHRALGEIESVRRLWNELRLAGPEPSILTEGRIVMAGALADTGDVPAGIRLLEKGPIKTKRARDYHVRLWYALADLYERGGDHQKARRGFERIQQVEPGYADVSDRLESLSNADTDVTSDSPYCLNLFFRTRGYDLLRPVGRELTHILATQGVVS